jgi:hypothetical protein
MTQFVILLARTGIQKAGVQYILDSVVEELQANPERRYLKSFCHFLLLLFCSDRLFIKIKF